MEALPSPRPSARVYADGELRGQPMLWVQASYLNHLGIIDPREDLIVKLRGEAPLGERNPISGDIEHIYELQAHDERGRRWWVSHLCCFSFNEPECAEPVVDDLVKEWEREHDEMTGFDFTDPGRHGEEDGA